ncbi:MAG: HEAT repeat domain-containing protein [Candidatus Brocadiia bacterium]
MRPAALWLAAALAAASTAPAGEVRPAVERLRRGEAGAKQRVIEAGPEAVGPLLELLGEAEAQAAWEARSALRWIALGARDDEEGRQAVLDAARPFLAAERSAPQRRAAIELLGLVGGESEVEALAGLLGEEGLAEPAAAAISRIWGTAGKAALYDALGSIRPRLGARILGLIASHREGDTLALFVGAAEHPNAAIRLAAIRAIGTLGDPDGALALVQAIREGDAETPAAAFDALLALAAAQLEAGDRPAARRLYAQALGLAPGDAQRAAALAGLGRVGQPAALPHIVPRLDAEDARVRGAAYAALRGIQGPAGVQGLLDALPRAPDDEKPLIVEALGARGGPQAARPLLDAARTDEPELALLAVQALARLREPDVAPDLLRLAEARATPEPVRRAALRVAIQLGHVLADRGRGAAAADLLAQALEQAEEPTARREALVGLGKSGELEAVALVRRAAEEAQGPVRQAAAQALLALGDAAADRGRRPAAAAAYAAVPDLGLDGADEAIKKLQTLGVHYRLARTGALAAWWLIGPFPCNDLRRDGTRTWFPEREIHLGKTYSVEGRSLRWRLVRSRDREGKMDLARLMDPSEKVLAYAYTELTLDAPQEATLAFRRDDGLSLWLNGQELYSEHGPHGIDQEEFTVDAALRQGLNRILVKCSQGKGDWGFVLRLTDRQGKPLEAP